MNDEQRPDWMTEMDIEILDLLSGGLIMTPSIIAENIDRSSEAVGRRLSTLEAAGFVKKQGRGKYMITVTGTQKLVEIEHGPLPDDTEDFDDLEPVEPDLSEEEKQKRAEEAAKRKERIESELGVTEEEYLNKVKQEITRIKRNPDLIADEDSEVIDVYETAFARVRMRLKNEADRE
jgi:DNA-binding transcriptional ArsR family regulator